MKFLRTTVVVASLVTFASVVPASASVAPTWHDAKQAALPKGAVGIPQGYLPTLTCVAPGTCEAAGALDTGDSVEGLILNETNGVWTTPVALTPPVDAAANPNVTIYALSCAGAGNCTVGGSYDDRAGSTQAFLANERGGKWSRALKVALPANALGTGQNASVRSLVCSSANDCSAVGGYLENNKVSPRNEGFVTSEVNATWRRPAEIETQAPANLNPFLSMNQLACASSGNCVAVGSFINVNSVTQGVVVDEVHGVWSRAVPLALPVNASAYAGASASEVACVKNSGCTVVGTFNSSTGAVEAMSASEVNGVWSRASELTMPANASTNPHVFLYGFNGIACSSVGNCSTGGQYQTSAGNYEGFLDSDVNGVWRSAGELALPSGAESAGMNGGVIALTCPSDGNCRAGAAYIDSAGNYQALVVSEVDGTWLSGVKVVLPGGATTVGVDGGIYALVCVTTSSCTGTGSFLRGATYEGFTLAS